MKDMASTTREIETNKLEMQLRLFSEKMDYQWKCEFHEYSASQLQRCSQHVGFLDIPILCDFKGGIIIL
jgi:hypothetical protein